MHGKIQIPATESGIEAAARLQREDGINVNLTSVSGVMHAAACAQSGAVALTLPIAKVSFFFLFSGFVSSLVCTSRARAKMFTPHPSPLFAYRCAIGAGTWDGISVTPRKMSSARGEKTRGRSPLILTCTACPPPRASSSAKWTMYVLSNQTLLRLFGHRGRGED